MVHVFSGPDDRADGLAAYLSKLGVPCVDLDIINFRQGEIKSSHDLSSDSLWETLRGVRGWANPGTVVRDSLFHIF